MTVLISFLIFIIATIFHVLFWRIGRIQSHMKPLLLVYTLIPLSLLGTCFSISWPITVEEKVLLFGLTMAFSAAYVLTFPAFQAIAPTLKICYLLGKNSAGLSLAEISHEFPSSSLVNDRLDDLLKDGMITVSEAGQLNLSRKGKLLAGVFSIYRHRILSLPEGEG